MPVPSRPPVKAPVYLDHAASTQMLPEAVEAMNAVRAGNYVVGRAPTEGVAEVANASGRGK